MAKEKRRTKEDKLRDELARRYYGMDYKDICSTRKRIIDEYAKEELESAPK